MQGAAQARLAEASAQLSPNDKPKGNLELDLGGYGRGREKEK